MFVFLFYHLFWGQNFYFARKNCSINAMLYKRNAKIAREALTQPWQHGDAEG
jgi:hypothetical protein